jgi:hypothetical protein
VAWLRTESKAAVGQALFIAPGTVATYLQRVRAKYARAGRAAHTKAALAARAIQDGYIAIDDLQNSGWRAHVMLRPDALFARSAVVPAGLRTPKIE